MWPDRAPVLFELGPETARDYLGKIEALVRRVARTHSRQWTKSVGREMACGPEGSPFAVYARDFAVKDDFYISRVADSHKQSIIDYCYELLRGEETGILMAQSDMTEYLRVWGKATHPVAARGGRTLIALDEARKTLPARPRRVYGDLLAIFRRYEATVAAMRELKTMTMRGLAAVDAEAWLATKLPEEARGNGG